MTPPNKHLVRAMAVVALASGLGACGSLGRRQAEQAQYTDEPVERIYNTGMEQLDRRRWAEALAAFEEVERQHPYSSWARRYSSSLNSERYCSGVSPGSSTT